MLKRCRHCPNVGNRATAAKRATNPPQPNRTSDITTCALNATVRPNVINTIACSATTTKRATTTTTTKRATNPRQPNRARAATATCALNGASRAAPLATFKHDVMNTLTRNVRIGWVNNALRTNALHVFVQMCIPTCAHARLEANMNNEWYMRKCTPN